MVFTSHPLKKTVEILVNLGYPLDGNTGK